MEVRHVQPRTTPIGGLPALAAALGLWACLTPIVAPARAEAVHLLEDGQVGAGYWVNLLSGRLWGYTTGLGLLDPMRADAPILFGSLPFARTSVDLLLAQLRTKTFVDGAFSFNQTYFPAGADAVLDLVYLEVVWRFAVLDRPHARLSLLPGVRIVGADVRLSASTAATELEDVVGLPEIGVLLQAEVHARTIIFGLFKYVDLTSDRHGSYTLQLEGGLSHLIPAPADRYPGWRLTAGVRFLDIEAVRRIGRPDQFGFDLEAVGPYVEAARLF